MVECLKIIWSSALYCEQKRSVSKAIFCVKDTLCCIALTHIPVIWESKDIKDSVQSISVFIHTAINILISYQTFFQCINNIILGIEIFLRYICKHRLKGTFKFIIFWLSCSRIFLHHLFGDDGEFFTSCKKTWDMVK